MKIIPVVSLLFVTALIHCGCGKADSPDVSGGNAPKSAEKGPAAASRKPLSAAAQAKLDDLNLRCGDPAWRSAFESIERPELRPTNTVVSGEAGAWLAACKSELAALGVKVKWNPEKKAYDGEAEK